MAQRTKMSLQAAVQQLGGFFIDAAGAHLSKGKEDVRDTSIVFSTYANFLAARVCDHRLLEQFAKHARVPVINALSDREHPCQALADLQTILELKGSTAKIAYVGDGNNVASSLAIGACMLRLDISVATPGGRYGLPKDVAVKCKEFNGELKTTTLPKEAVSDADIVYTDVWTSMGDEAEEKARLAAFAGFQVNKTLMALAKPDAAFMHCMPAKKGVEVTAEVFDGPQSVVFRQAENRLHAQKALLLFLESERN